MVEMNPVYSSHINQIGYDPETTSLIVEYQNGKTVAYDGVPEQVAYSVIKAPSIGEALHLSVRGAYQFRYL